jgi:uncharacterized protein (DUF2141 family)
MVFKTLFIISTLFTFVCCVNHDLNKKYSCEASDLVLILDSISSATNCSVADGIIYVTAQGGNEPYKFSLNNLPAQFISTFSNLSSGIYSISVTDNNGCKVSLDNIVVLAEGFKFSATVTNDNQCLAHNGSIAVEVQEGNGPFTYTLNQDKFSNNNIFTGLSAGQYAVAIQDAALCTIQLNVTVPRGNTGVSWTGDILPIMKNSCAINGCHDGNNRVDYRIYSNVKKDLQQVKSSTKNKTMPFDGTPLPQSQIDQIGCWVDDGGVEN